MWFYGEDWGNQLDHLESDRNKEGVGSKRPVQSAQGVPQVLVVAPSSYQYGCLIRDTSQHSTTTEMNGLLPGA